MNTHIKKGQRGFTLVELLVAIAIFSIVVAIGVGGFVHALHTQREVAALIATQSNASDALEQMTREMRTGYLFCTTKNNNDNPENALPSICDPNNLYTGAGCTTSGGTDPVWTCNDILDFYNAASDEVDYKLTRGGSLVRSQNGPGGPFIPLTDNNVNVSYLTFTIFGNTEGDNWPPRITISMGVSPSSTDPVLESDVVDLQTTVSARDIDCTIGASPEC